MKEKNDILQVYRQRQDEFHLPLREGGWEKLEAELFTGRKRHLPYRLLTIAAIGLVCLAVSLTIYFRKQDTPVMTSVPSNTIERSHEDHKADVDEPEIKEEPEMSFNSPIKIQEPILSQNNMRVEPEEIKEPVPEEEKKDNVGPEQKAEAETRREKSKKDMGPKADKGPSFEIIRTEKNRKVPHKWAFGVNAGMTDFSKVDGGYGGGIVTSPGPTNPEKPEPPEPPEKKTRAAVGGTPGGSSDDINYKHDIPISVSLSMRRYITERLALETGLSYTYLHSDLTWGNGKYMGEQTLHYIGVPLKLNWDFFRRKPVSFYLSGGGTLEYCLSAEREGRSMDISKWQTSLHAGVGVELQLYKQFSMYAEPGVIWYIDPDKKVDTETIRVARPFTFNLQLGLRFTY